MKRLILTSLILTATVMTFCSRSDHVSQVIETRTDLTDYLLPENAGRLHNVLLERSLKAYNPVEVINRDNDLRQVNISKLVDYVASQPEVSDVMNDQIIQDVKEFFLGFKPDGIRSYTIESFIDYVDQKIIEKSGISYEDILSGNRDVYAKSSISEDQLFIAKQNAVSIRSASSEFWPQFYREEGIIKNRDYFVRFPVDNLELIKERWIPITLCDAICGTWGSLFGPHGYAIAATLGSIIGEIIDEWDRPQNPPPADVPFWQTNPKWC